MNPSTQIAFAILDASEMEKSAFAALGKAIPKALGKAIPKLTKNIGSLWSALKNNIGRSEINRAARKFPPIAGPHWSGMNRIPPGTPFSKIPPPMGIPRQAPGRGIEPRGIPDHPSSFPTPPPTVRRGSGPTPRPQADPNNPYADIAQDLAQDLVEAGFSDPDAADQSFR